MAVFQTGVSFTMKEMPENRRKRLAEWFSNRPRPEDEKSYLSQLINAKASFGEKAARRIERKYNMPENYLDQITVAGAVTYSPRIKGVALAGSVEQVDYPDNVREGPEIRGLVPLISSVQAGHWSEIVENFQPGDAEMWYPCPVKHGKETFCLRVYGESMQHPGHKPSYDPGDIIFVDRGRLPPKPRDCVVARLDDKNEATFKQYVEEDGIKKLKALNPDWEPKYIDINNKTTLSGVVIGKWVDP
jgi:SOS-response transcriptional repressor LexA